MVASVAALAVFVGVWGPLTWLAVRGAEPSRPTRPPPPPATIDGRWLVVPDRSSLRTALVSVRRLTGDARVTGRVLVRAHVSGGNATFDLTRPVSLAEVRQGRRERVSFPGKAQLLFLSRRVTVPVDVLWVADRLTISGRSGDNELHLELRR